MTEYTDVSTVNTLYVESQNVAQALAHLEAGGTITNMMVAPPPPPPPDPTQPLQPMKMSVQVQVPTATPQLIAQIQVWLEGRLVEIAAEMTALGITVPPPADMLRAAPPLPGPINAPPQRRVA